MTDPDLRLELRRLAERLERLERLFDLDSIAPAARPAQEPPKPPLPFVTVPVETPASLAPKAVETPDAPTLTHSSGIPPAPVHRSPAMKAATFASSRPAVAKGTHKTDRFSLEMLIGGRWMAWVGALAVVVGVGLFIKFAYDEGWFRVLSRATRCAVSAAFGLFLLGLGEAALRKISRPASVGLFGAGLGTLYVTALVSFRLHVLGSPGLTLVLLAAVSVIGITVAVRAGLLSIGVVSIVAGYAAPLLVPGAGDIAAALPSYLTMMLLIGLGLSALRPRPFRTLRIVTFAAHAVLGTLWILDVGSGGGVVELVFMSGWWMMITGEVVYAAIRRQSSLGNPIISLLATAWFALFGCVLLNTTTLLPAGFAGAFAAGVGVLAGAIAMQFGPGLDALRRLPQNAIEKLAASLWVQAGCLLVVAAALHFTDYGTTIAWLILAVAAIEIGRRIESTATERFGLVVGALGLVRLLSLDLFQGAGVTAMTVGSVSISQWTLLALGGIAVLHFAAWRLRQTGSYPRLYTPGVLVATSILLWLLLTQLDLEDLWITIAWIGGAVTLIALGAFVTRLPYVQTGAYMLAFAALRWVGYDMLGERLMSFPDWISRSPVLNFSVFVGLLIIASGGVALWANRRQGVARGAAKHESAWPVLYGMGLLGMILISFEVDRGVAIYEHAQGETLRERWAPGQLLSLWLTLLWGMMGIFTALFGAWQRRQTLFSIGTWAAVVCAAVWLTWDTLFYRVVLSASRAAVLFNLQFFVGIMLAIGLGASVRLIGYRRIGRQYQFALDPDGNFARAALTLIAIIGLWLGSLEIDRFFNPDTSTLASAAMARQTGLSIYWGIYGIALVGVGFVWRLAQSRYAGLALLAITLVKVVFVDMSEVQYIYRVASFIGVGLLFVLTSIAYAKMSPRLLAANASETKPVGEPT